jgi:hypothetical protein
MKNLILGVALVTCALACKTEKSASITDPSAPNAPAAECCTEKKGDCSDMAAKGQCSSEAKASCPSMKPSN